jgi:hypothetical protein
MSGMPNLAKPLVRLSDPLGIMPKEFQRQLSDPLNLVSKPEEPAPPTQQQLYSIAQSQQQAKRAAAIDSANTTNASLSRASMGATYLGG